MSQVLEINAGEIAKLRFSNPLSGHYVFADNDVVFPIVAVTEIGPIMEGYRTGALGLITKTGEKVSREGLIRCRVTFARDLGDVEGTLVFDGENIGGEVNFRVFESC